MADHDHDDDACEEPDFNLRREIIVGTKRGLYVITVNTAAGFEWLDENDAYLTEDDWLDDYSFEMKPKDVVGFVVAAQAAGLTLDMDTPE